MCILPVAAIAMAAFLVIARSSPTSSKDATVVNNFDTRRYLGTWYEIACFDHRFERGLDKMAATYSLRNDGGVNVINKGYNPDRGVWQKTGGKAYFTSDPSRVVFKVSLFGPFYGGYNATVLDREHHRALICGPDRDYLQILSRTPTISDEMRQQMLAIVTWGGFEVNKLIRVKQPGA